MSRAEQDCILCFLNNSYKIVELLMKKSINAWSFPKEYTFAQCIDAAIAAGFDGIEFNLDRSNEGHSFTVDTKDSEILEVGRLCEAKGLKIVSISSSLHSGNWSRNDSNSVEYITNVLDRQLNIAKLLGADTILLVPGGMPEGIMLAEARENSLRNLKNALPIIEKYGVTVGLENVWNGFFLSPYDMLSFLDDLNSPMFSLYFDLGNMVAFSDSVFWCDIVGGRCAKVHIKDFKRNGGINSGGVFCNLLEGDLDFKGAMAAMKRRGFDGYLTAEVFKPENQTYEEFFAAVSSAEDVIIGYYNEA